MNPSKLADSILKKIEQDKITPRSKFFFWAKNISFWALFTLAIMAGAISVAVILYATGNTDFAVSEFVEQEEILEHWLTLLPIIWILLVGIAIGIGMVGLKHTKRGYRIALFTLIGSNVLGSLLLGSGLYAAGGGEIIEEVLEEHVEIYQGVRKKHQKFWGNPERTGRLAGRIKSIDKESQILTLEGPFGRTWEVPYDEARPPNDTEIEVGNLFKMRGKVETEGRFKPRGLKPAHRQERLHRKAEDHLRRNPQLRRKFEQKLNPETREKLKDLKASGQRPDRKMREQIRQEVRANTTPEERDELHDSILESIEELERSL